MGRVRELDGLRGVAVLLVVASHATEIGYHPLWQGQWEVAGGGLVGVQLFFVLSGFLITSILLDARDRLGRVSLGRFYLRRGQRLLPALVTVCGLYLAWAALSGASLRGAAGADLRALTYTADLLHLWRHVPDSLWLSHTWSLAIEEQFYLVWGVAMAFLPRRLIPWSAAAMIVATIVIRHLISPHDPSMYHFWRWDALGLGCLLACWRPKLPRGAGWVAALVLGLYCFVHFDWVRPEDFTLTAAAAGAAVLAAPRSGFLTARPLVWFGTISYGLYLWHSLLLNAGMPAITATPAAVLLAWVSWHWIEQPILRLGQSRTTAWDEHAAVGLVARQLSRHATEQPTISLSPQT